MKILSNYRSFIAPDADAGQNPATTRYGTGMWNVLKFTYHFAGEADIRTRIHAYLHLGEAETMFDHLRLAYQFDAPLRVRDGKRIKLDSVSLYTSFREDRAQAEAEVENGGARLIQEAHEMEIDLE